MATALRLVAAQMMGKAEQWMQALDDIVRRYRTGLVAKTETTLTLDQALELTRALHLSDGEALRYLEPKKRK